MENFTLDAKNMSIGRVASKAASILIGKNSPDFARNVVPNVKVTIINTSKARITEKKMKEKTYKTYSGYPGGLKTLEMEKVVAKKGYSELFRLAVYGMLPTNKLRAKMILNLIVTE